MEIIIEFLNSHLTILYFAGAVIIALKILVALGLKGFSFVPIFVTFISFYSHDRIDAEKRLSTKRAFLMWSSNLLNVFFYLWLFTIVMYNVVTMNVNKF